MGHVYLYDTTLRDGAQAEEVNFTATDKISIIRLLDEYRIDYIEAGWPYSSKEDAEVFEKVRSVGLKHAKISAFGSTHNKNIPAHKDPNLEAIIRSGAEIGCIFGKTIHEHIKKQLKLSPQRNLELIFDSVAYLRSKGITVFYDAEHFFDGFLDDPGYALKCLEKASDAGARELVLCDTNGGMQPEEVYTITKEVYEHFRNRETSKERDNQDAVSLGIHMHNDGELAVANSLIALDFVDHIQGTINGLGERCGNANLCSIIPNLSLKRSLPVNADVKKTKYVSEMVYTLSNIRPNPKQPFTGKSAFTHKGGTHVDAVLKGASYEHIDPESVGNVRRILVSKQSGGANIVAMAAEYGYIIDRKDPRIKAMREEIEHMDTIGYEIESMPAERFLIAHKHLSGKKDIFEITGWRALSEDFENEGSEAVIKGKVGTIEDLVVARVSKEGPVAAIYDATQKLIRTRYPEIDQVTLKNFKVRIAEDKGQDSKVRTYVEFCNNGDLWGAAGISRNILKASMIAVKKGFSYYLNRYCS